MAKDQSDLTPPADTQPAPETKAPTKLKLKVLYGFYDEHNRYRGWNEGDVITDESEIKLLMERGAPVEVLE